MKKKEKKSEDGAPEWMVTYGDMVTLLLVFFITMFSIDDIAEPGVLKIIMSSFTGAGYLSGGRTLEESKLSFLGNTFLSLPSSIKKKSVKGDENRKKISSQFFDEIKSQTMTVRTNEKGFVISLATDSFFDPGSANVKIDDNRETLQKLSSFISSLNNTGANFKIEGHTDNTSDISASWKNNWELSTMRAINMLEQILNYTNSFERAQIESKFEVAGFAHTRPFSDNSIPEGRAFNRRIDILISAEGLFGKEKEVLQYD